MNLADFDCVLAGAHEPCGACIACKQELNDDEPIPFALSDAALEAFDDSDVEDGGEDE